MTEIAEQVRDQGFATMEFPIDLADRRYVAQLGNTVIDIAEANPDIMNALTYDGASGSVETVPSTTKYAVRGPHVAKDDSIWFHSGWQTKDRVDNMLARSRRTKELDEFLGLQREILHGVATTWMDFFRAIHPGKADLENGVNSMIYDSRNLANNNHHLRIVRYRNISAVEPGTETFSAHGDMGLVTGHLFNTHNGHLHISPYPISKIDGEEDHLRERATHARSLHEIAKQVEYDPDKQAVIFLGFGAAYLTDPDGTAPFIDKSAGYHFGTPPETPEPIDGHTDEDFGEDTRVTMVAFGHPHMQTPYVRYRTAGRNECRPEQMHAEKSELY